MPPISYRCLKEMRSLLFDSQAVKDWPDDLKLYEMQRGLKQKDNQRYDITSLKPLRLGQEFNKTKGHSHPRPFVETYQVLQGQAIFLLQEYDAGLAQIKKVYYVSAQKGQTIKIPSNLGHITINIGAETLQLGNWLDKDCPSDYSLFEQKHGACYYLLCESRNQLKWIVNKNYGQVPAIYEVKSTN